MYLGNSYYFEQVYRNIIKIPIFDLSSDVYLKNIEIVSTDNKYTIDVVSFVSSTVEHSNDTFMYEYMIKVSINYTEMHTGSMTVDNYMSRLKHTNDYFVTADFVLVFADSTGKEIRMKVKDINM